MVGEFTKGPRNPASIPGRVIPKTQKMFLVAILLNSQHYKVRIKGKVEQSRERSSVLLNNLGVVALEKGAFELPSILYIYIYIYYIYISSREGVAPSPTHRCSSYRKGSLRVTLDYGRQLYLLIYIVTPARISLTFVIRLYSPSHLAGPLECILCPYRVFDDKFYLAVQHLFVRLSHRRTSLMPSSLLHQ